MKEKWTAGGFLSETSWTTTAERQPVVGYHTLSKQSSCECKQTHGHTSHTKVNKDLIILWIIVLLFIVFPWIMYLSNCCKVLPIRRPLCNVNGCSGSEWQRQKTVMSAVFTSLWGNTCKRFFFQLSLCMCSYSVVILEFAFPCSRWFPGYAHVLSDDNY